VLANPAPEGVTELTDRGVVVVAGPTARAFLQGLVTNDVLGLADGEARYAALLSPQGKILFDFFIIAPPSGEGALFLECSRAIAAALVKRLNFYKLRANVSIEDCSESYAVAAGWGARAAALTGLVFADPRDPSIGRRAILRRPVPAEWTMDDESRNAYESLRLALGVPKAEADFAYGDAFAHEANLDLMHGVDFKKGCYIGQEVVSRVEHRGSARTRIVRVTFDGGPPARGAPITTAEGEPLGTMGSAVAGHGLAMVRLDKIRDALARAADLRCDGLSVAFHISAGVSRQPSTQ
jgi:folate-binding protein YgfZ